MSSQKGSLLWLKGVRNVFSHDTKSVSLTSSFKSFILSCVLYISPTKDFPSRKLLTHTHTHTHKNNRFMQTAKNVHNRNDNYNDC